MKDPEGAYAHDSQTSRIIVAFGAQQVNVSGPSLTNQKTNAGYQCQQRNQNAELAE
jgi:hypothetical protein